MKIIPVSQKLTLYENGKVLDKSNGSLLDTNKQDVADLVARQIDNPRLDAVSVSSNIELVTSLGSMVFDLSLKNSLQAFSGSGFLVEVYFSGSDGKLTRMYQEDVVDPIDESIIINEGFSKYFKLETDK